MYHSSSASCFAASAPDAAAELHSPGRARPRPRFPQGCLLVCVDHALFPSLGLNAASNRQTRRHEFQLEALVEWLARFEPEMVLTDQSLEAGESVVSDVLGRLSSTCGTETIELLREHQPGDERARETSRLLLRAAELEFQLHKGSQPAASSLLDRLYWLNSSEGGTGILSAAQGAGNSAIREEAVVSIAGTIRRLSEAGKRMICMLEWMTARRVQSHFARTSTACGLVSTCTVPHSGQDADRGSLRRRAGEATLPSALAYLG